MDDPVEHSRDRTKARKAAADPRRPGERCRAEPGAFVPVVSRSRCEGKADCVAVCPHDVFALDVLTDPEFEALGLLGRLKARAHGRKTVRLPHADACRACGLCVVACPEKALRLERLPSAPPSA